MPMIPRTAILNTLLLILAVQLAITDGVPHKVTGVSVSKAVKDGNPSLRVTWNALHQNVADLLEYHVEYGRSSGEFTWGSLVSTRATSTLLPKLSPSTEYNVRVRAVSEAGEGEWSDVHTETTFNITNVSVTKSVEDGNLTLTVSWTTPQSELPITEYEVEYRTSDTESWINSTRLSLSPSAHSTTLTRLDAGVEYIIRVRASSEIGAGAWSDEQTLATPSDNNCLGPGFTQTIPAREEWWQYSTTVLKPGDAAVYSSLSFACNGTLQSLTIPSVFRGSIYSYSRYLYLGVSVWRFNETGYYQVREFQDSVLTELFQEVPESSVFWATVSIFPRMEVLAKDTLAFRLLLPLGPVYQHMPILFKPSPPPGAFIPVVSATFIASSGPVTDEADSTQSPANGTENNILQNAYEGVIFGIFLAVCQVEVIVVAIATALIVHFITKGCIKRNLTLSHGRSENAAELDPVRPDNRPLYESVDLGDSTEEHVEMQSSPAYQVISKPEYL